ncbi:hypothetical protein Purlil1_3575 [Purpureocillium lilacinum]|uniref:Uncharacterized protein n=1 Tax=Purpureocillium lilacinum TaxID=33203 RepID=A0ABR0C800_PURLI|nr:hypothetical protein Purlil1_3575 [Purpureocillium lilacinum]
MAAAQVLGEPCAPSRPWARRSPLEPTKWQSQSQGHRRAVAVRIAAQHGRPGGHLGKRSPPKAADWALGLAGYPFRDILAKGEAGANQASQANPEDFPLVPTSKVAGTVPKRTCHSPPTAPHYATTVTTRTLIHASCLTRVSSDPISPPTSEAHPSLSSPLSSPLPSPPPHAAPLLQPELEKLRPAGTPAAHLRMSPAQIASRGRRALGALSVA